LPILNNPACPICGARTPSSEHKKVFDDRYGYPGFFDIKKCPDCSHRFCWPSLSEANLAGVYNFYGRSGAVAVDVEVGARRAVKMTSFRRYLAGTNNLGQYFAPKGSTILDVGSGDGSNLFEASLLGHPTIGFDVDPEANRLGAELGLEVRIAMNLGQAFSREKFKWVQLNQVVEHFVFPGDQMSVLVKLLEEKGKIFIATPNVNSIYRRVFGRNWINWHVPYHQHHFSKKSLTHLAESSGLKVDSWFTTTPNVWLRLQLFSFIHKSQPGAPSQNWVGSGSLPVSLPSRLKSISLRLGWITLSPLIVLLARILDALALGDCQVAILVRKT